MDVFEAAAICAGGIASISLPSSSTAGESSSTPPPFSSSQTASLNSTKFVANQAGLVFCADDVSNTSLLITSNATFAGPQSTLHLINTNTAFISC
jgi:hypothetical protein